jgi:hypothetical protein
LTATSAFLRPVAAAPSPLHTRSLHINSLFTHQGITMNFKLRSLVFTAALSLLPLAHAATMNKDAYKAAKSGIETDYNVARAACAQSAGNTKDVCIQEAKAKEKVARADLEYRYSGKAADQTKLAMVKAETAYAVAKEKCDDKGGNVKDVCIKEAKAAETTALADAKAGKQIGEARKDAAEEKREAEYQVEAAKCDAMAGDAKANCMNAVKAMFGKG